MSLPATASLVSALKSLPKYSIAGSLAFANPFYSATAPPIPPHDHKDYHQLILEVEHAIECLLAPACLTLDRSRLFFMEEPGTLSNPDIMLIVIYTALGRLCRRAKTLRDVHDVFRSAIIGQTKFRALPPTKAAALRDAEGEFDTPPPSGLAGQYSDNDCEGVAEALDCIMQYLEWTDKDLMDLAQSVKSKTKRANFPYLMITQYIGRSISLGTNRSSVLAEPITTTTSSGTRSKVKRSRRQQTLEKTFDKVQGWIAGKQVRFVHSGKGDRIIVLFTAKDAYNKDAIRVGGEVAPDTHARYEQVLARAVAEVAPQCRTLADQVEIIQDKSRKNQLRVALEIHAQKYNLPGTGKGILAQSIMLSKIWVKEAKKCGKKLDKTLTIDREIELCRLLVVEGYGPDDRLHDLTDEVDSVELAPLLGIDTPELIRRLKDCRQFFPLDAAEQYCHGVQAADEDEDMEMENLYSSGSSMEGDEYDSEASSISDFFPALREEMAEGV